MSKPKPKDKPFAIPKQLVWEAYRQVAANKGAPGVAHGSLQFTLVWLEFCRETAAKRSFSAKIASRGNPVRPWEIRD